MLVAESVTIEATPEEIWEVVSDPDHYLRTMRGIITRFEPQGRETRGLGARYAMRLHVGSAQVGGLIEIGRTLSRSSLSSRSSFAMPSPRVRKSAVS